MTLVLIQTCIPHYRQRILQAVRVIDLSGFDVYAGDDQFDATVLTDLDPGFAYRRLRNRYFLHRKLLWQSGALVPGIRADRLLLELNPRILNVWLTVIARKMLRRRTTLWGHAWSRQGQHAPGGWKRDALKRLGDTVLLYTDSEAAEVRARIQGIRVMAAPNAMFDEADAFIESPATPPMDFVFSGRLVPFKKVDIAVDAFAEARALLPSGARLVVLGDGPLRMDLERRAADRGIGDRVDFAGQVTDTAELRHAYANAIASLSPGAVGLALTQSLWFGVPMLIAEGEPHAPEIEAAIEGETAFFFPKDDVSGLAKLMVDRARCAVDPRTRARLAARCQSRYSVSRMARQLVASTVYGPANGEIAA